MKIHNKTPLVPLTLPMVDENGAPMLSVITKGTFDIVPDKPATFSKTPASIREAPIFWDSEKPSSLRFEDDIAPFKPCTDVIVNGTAFAPGGKPLPSWRAGIRVGSLQKQVVVTGPRAWVHTPLLGWSLSPIVPVRHAPLRYELAFGGAGCDENPVGIGRVDRARVDKSKTVLAPQILCGDGVTPRFGEAYPVEGFGAINRMWQPRRGFAGSFDVKRLQQEGKTLPEDFSIVYWNAAHPDLCADSFFRGDEEVVLTAMHPEMATIRFGLPNQLVAVGLVHASGFRHGSPARLDTIFIDVDTMKMELTWRTTIPLFKEAVASVHIAMRPLQPIGGPS